MNQIFEIEGVYPGTKLLIGETNDRLAVKVVAEINGIQGAEVLLDYQAKHDLFGLAYKLEVRRAHDISDEDGT